MNLPFHLPDLLAVVPDRIWHHEEPEALTRFAPFGFTRFADAGTYKAVFFHEADEWVLKVARNSTCTREIEREAANYRTLRPDIRHRFAETHLARRGVSLQACWPIDVRKFLTHKDEIEDFEPEFRVGDIHEYNVGWRGDQWAFIDFPHLFTRNGKAIPCGVAK
jgi:hypothetical protein